MLSQWLCQTTGGLRPQELVDRVIAGLLMETGVPYMLTALSCLHAGLFSSQPGLCAML